MKTNINTSVIVNIIRTLTMTLLSLVTFPYVCRVLGDTAFGAYSWVSSFVYYFFILARISIPNIAVRECVKVKDDPAKLSIKVQELFIIQAVMTLISFLLMTGIIFIVPAFKMSEGLSYDYITLAFILSLNFLTGVLSFEWVFTAFEKHTFMSVRSIIIHTLSAILIFAFVRNPGHVTLYAFLAIIGTVLTVITNLIYLPKLVKFKKEEPYNFKQYFPILAILFVISIVAAVYDKTDSFILGIIDQSKASVGSYSVAMKAIEVIIGVMTSLSIVFVPRAAYYKEKNDEKQYRNLNKYAVNIALFIIIPAIATMVALATPLTELISGSYESGGYKDTNYVLIALTLLMLTYSISYIIYTQILIPNKKETIYMWSMLVGFILNIGLSLLFGLVLFKDHPAIGVAIATSISDLVVLVIMFVLTWKDSKETFFNWNTVKIVGVGIAIAIFTVFIGPLIRNAVMIVTESIETSYILEIITMVLVDAVIYLLSLYLLKEKLVTSFLNRRKTTK